ncbi:hypothetical protein [Pyxidicoccus fallax]|nr:hypothetical protein [Pyxidicoccus fallax]
MQGPRPEDAWQDLQRALDIAQDIPGREQQVGALQQLPVRKAA